MMSTVLVQIMEGDMFKMIEVIGTSPEGFSAAVKNAVESVIHSGERVHFFEVIEQRGSVREGALKEFQVKIKVAADAEKQPGKCPTCNKPADEPGHLCVPIHYKNQKCDWCGALIPDERHLCNQKVKDLAYICNTCGRTAVSAQHLCQPGKINPPGKSNKKQ